MLLRVDPPRPSPQVSDRGPPVLLRPVVRTALVVAHPTDAAPVAGVLLHVTAHVPPQVVPVRVLVIQGAVPLVHLAVLLLLLVVRLGAPGVPLRVLVLEDVPTG